MGKLLFARVGGLSPVKQVGERDKNTYHYPPAKKGIYAFIWPYITPFLFMWCVKNHQELKLNGIRKFEYNGLLWTHMHEAIMFSGKTKGTWYEVHTNDLPEILRRNKAAAVKELVKNEFMSMRGQFITDPYKRGKNGFFSKDHLEVFIERP